MKYILKKLCKMFIKVLFYILYIFLQNMYFFNLILHYNFTKQIQNKQ